MIAAIEIPRAFVERARLHLTRTGRPLLLHDRRRVNDLELVCLPEAQGYLITVGPTTPVAQIYVAMKRRYPHRDLAADLCSVTAVGLEGLHRRFTCEGLTVGLWDLSEGCVCVRGPVALSCMSWALLKRRIGFYLTLMDVETE